MKETRERTIKAYYELRNRPTTFEDGVAERESSRVRVHITPKSLNTYTHIHMRIYRYVHIYKHIIYMHTYF